MKNPPGHADRASGGLGVKAPATINYYVAGLQDAQPALLVGLEGLALLPWTPPSARVG